MNELQSGAAAPTQLNDVMVPMRDGVHLATDVYFPDRYRVGIDAPLPTILERTPYGKRAASRSEIHHGQPAMNRVDLARYFTARGYAVVFQDRRGRYGSEGVCTKYVSEDPDGFDTMEWLVRHPPGRRIRIEASHMGVLLSKRQARRHRGTRSCWLSAEFVTTSKRTGVEEVR